MKIAIIGATGFVGSGILTEALDRGHDVTAIERSPGKLPDHARLTAVNADVHERATLASAIAGHDVVISAFNPGGDEDGQGVRSIIAAVKRSGVGRLVAVGGAGKLEVAPGQRLSTSPAFRPSGRTARSRPPPFSSCCAARTISTGRSSARRRCSRLASAPAPIASAATG